jgi:hypothetical protein
MKCLSTCMSMYNGHPSMRATRKLVKDRFWCKNIHADVGDYMRSCHYYQMTNQPTTERLDGRTFTSTQVDMPMEKIGFDLLGPFPETPEKYKYVYVWYDLYLGWVGAGLGTSKDTKEIARFLKLDVFAGHGCPGLAITDKDAYVSEVRELFDGMGIKVPTIVSYSPYQTGDTEAIVKLLTKSTRKLVLQTQNIGQSTFTRRSSSPGFACAQQHVSCLSRLSVGGPRCCHRNACWPTGTKFRWKKPSAESENDQQALHEQALTRLIEVRRLNVLLRATHQANLRATAAAKRDISHMRAEAAFQKRQHRGVYQVTNLVRGQLVIIRKPKREAQARPRMGMTLPLQDMF